MAIATITNKKFLDSVGTGYLWEKIKERYDSKLDSVSAADNSIAITNNSQIAVKISPATGNALQVKTTTGEEGLFVANSATDSYAIVQDQNSLNYAAVYRLKHYLSPSDATGTDVGVINIPKDMVVQSGTVETKTVGGTWGNPGTYICLTLANANGDILYIPADGLVEYITSGSQTGDAVYLTVNPSTHQITGQITDGSITMQMLDATLASAIEEGAGISNITEGATDGTISVDGMDIAVHGLGTAAYEDASAFDAAGAANAVLGSSGDTAATVTVNGVKQYASDAYDAIKALTTAEIDAALLAASLASA